MLRHFRTVAVLQPGDAFLPVAHQLRVHALAAHALSSGNLGHRNTAADFQHSAVSLLGHAHDPGSALDHDTEGALDEVIQALEEDLPWRDAHTRLAVRTQEWASAQRDRSFLLRGSDLHAAEEWLGQAR